MSQVFSQALDPDWVSLSIVKFSHNTSAYGTRTYTWNHISSRNDLDFVIRNARYVDGDAKNGTRVIMKVSAGAEEMEKQDLLELVRFCQQYNPSTGAEHPVEVAIKSPFLAMRYPKTVNTVVRRLQIKFRSHEDYCKVYTILKDLGLPITNRETTTSNIPQPPPSPALSLSASTTSSSTLLRPSSGLDVPGPYIPNYSTSSLKSEFKIPPRPDSTISEDISVADELPRPFSTSLTSSAMMINPPLSRINSFQRPATQIGNLYLPHLEREVRDLSHPSSQLLDNAALDVHPRTSLYVDQLQNLRQERVGMTGANSRNLSTSPIFPPCTYLPAASNHATFKPYTALEPQNVRRPASTPGTLSTIMSDVPDYQSISTLALPPRRELPFPKLKEQNQSRSMSPSDQPQLSKDRPVILPPSKLSNLAKEISSTPASKPAPQKRVAQRKASTIKVTDEVSSKTKLGVGEPVIAEPHSVTEEPSPLAAKSAAVLARPSSTPTGLVSKAAPPTKKRAPTPAIRPSSSNKRSKMVNQSTQTDTPLDQRQAVQQAEPHSNTTSSTTTLTLPISSPPYNYLQAIDAFVVKHKSRPPPTELWETPGWADADDDQRHNLIDNFICENLENPQFLKLCEDMDTSWKRIGLGM